MKNKKTIASILSAATVLSMCVSPIGTLAKNKGSSEGVVSHAVNWVKTHVWQSATTATAAVASIVIVAIVKHNMADKTADALAPKAEEPNAEKPDAAAATEVDTSLPRRSSSSAPHVSHKRHLSQASEDILSKLKESSLITEATVSEDGSSLTLSGNIEFMNEIISSNCYTISQENVDEIIKELDKITEDYLKKLTEPIAVPQIDTKPSVIKIPISKKKQKIIPCDEFASSSITGTMVIHEKCKLAAESAAAKSDVNTPVLTLSSVLLRAEVNPESPAARALAAGKESLETVQKLKVPKQKRRKKRSRKKTNASENLGALQTITGMVFEYK